MESVNTSNPPARDAAPSRDAATIGEPAGVAGFEAAPGRVLAPLNTDAHCSEKELTKSAGHAVTGSLPTRPGAYVPDTSAATAGPTCSEPMGKAPKPLAYPRLALATDPPTAAPEAAVSAACGSAFTTTPNAKPPDAVGANTRATEGGRAIGCGVGVTNRTTSAASETDTAREAASSRSPSGAAA